MTLVPAKEAATLEQACYGKASGAASDGRVDGVVSFVGKEHCHKVLGQLDHREKAGYSRASVDVTCADGETRSALVRLLTGGLQSQTKPVVPPLSPNRSSWQQQTMTIFSALLPSRTWPSRYAPLLPCDLAFSSSHVLADC